MRGSWGTNTPDDLHEGYNGALVITRDTITITGYQGFIGTGVNENTRPFSGFTRNATLSGYTEKTANLESPPDQTGILYIKDAGVWKPGIVYTFYRTGTYPYQYFLRFTFRQRRDAAEDRIT